MTLPYPSTVSSVPLNIGGDSNKSRIGFSQPSPNADSAHRVPNKEWILNTLSNFDPSILAHGGLPFRQIPSSKLPPACDKLIFVTDVDLTGSAGLVGMFPTWAEMTWAKPAKQVEFCIIMTRKRNSGNLHPFDPEIDRTLNRIRKSKNMHVGHSSDNYLQLEPAQSYELKFGLIHMLPKFHNLAGEDSHKHLKEFHMVCSTIRPQGILEDYIKMKAFLFSLDEAAKD
ncbi:hypothetical protein CR513_37556, partial [Mucuna pruriens]